MELFGENFERFESEAAVEEAAEEEAPNGSASELLGPSSSAPDKSKKGKIAAKATGHTYQFQILESIGVPRTEVKKFADPQYWLRYFPPIAVVRLHRLHYVNWIFISSCV